MKLPALAIATICLVASAPVYALNLTPAQKLEIGRKVWKNECAGTVEGLVDWNAGEGFPSLGIGHFIWYPEGKRGRFDESFPKLRDFLGQQGIATPKFLEGPAPWASKQAMVRDAERVNALRKFLSRQDVLGAQAEFLILRLQAALPKLLAASKEPALVRRRFEMLTQSAAGAFALVDYVNFKGEGVLASERYRGEGWGLLQVLEGMEEGEPVRAFSRSAGRVLTRRVHNAPPERNEARWLKGWLARVNRYAPAKSSR